LGIDFRASIPDFCFNVGSVSVQYSKGKFGIYGIENPVWTAIKLLQGGIKSPFSTDGYMRFTIKDPLDALDGTQDGKISFTIKVGIDPFSYKQTFNFDSPLSDSNGIIAEFKIPDPLETLLPFDNTLNGIIDFQIPNPNLFAELLGFEVEYGGGFASDEDWINIVDLFANPQGDNLNLQIPYIAIDWVDLWHIDLQGNMYGDNVNEGAYTNVPTFVFNLFDVFLKQILAALRKLIEEILNAVFKFFFELAIESHLEEAKNDLDNLKDPIKSMLDNLKQVLMVGVDIINPKMFNVFSNLLGGLMEKIPFDAISEVFNIVGPITESLGQFGFVLEIAQFALVGLSQIIIEIFTQILEDIFSGLIGELIDSLIGELDTLFDPVLDKLVNSFTLLFDEMDSDKEIDLNSETLSQSLSGSSNFLGMLGSLPYVFSFLNNFNIGNQYSNFITEFKTAIKDVLDLLSSDEFLDTILGLAAPIYSLILTISTLFNSGVTSPSSTTKTTTNYDLEVSKTSESRSLHCTKLRYTTSTKSLDEDDPTLSFLSSLHFAAFEGAKSFFKDVLNWSDFGIYLFGVFIKELSKILVKAIKLVLNKLKESIVSLKDALKKGGGIRTLWKELTSKKPEETKPEFYNGPDLLVIAENALNTQFWKMLFKCLQYLFDAIFFNFGDFLMGKIPEEKRIVETQKIVLKTGVYILKAFVTPFLSNFGQTLKYARMQFWGNDPAKTGLDYESTDRLPLLFVIGKRVELDKSKLNYYGKLCFKVSYRILTGTSVGDPKPKRIYNSDAVNFAQPSKTLNLDKYLNKGKYIALTVVHLILHMMTKLSSTLIDTIIKNLPDTDLSASLNWLIILKALISDDIFKIFEFDAELDMQDEDLWKVLPFALGDVVLGSILNIYKLREYFEDLLSSVSTSFLEAAASLLGFIVEIINTFIEILKTIDDFLSLAQDIIAFYLNVVGYRETQNLNHNNYKRGQRKGLDSFATKFNFMTKIRILSWFADDTKNILCMENFNGQSLTGLIANIRTRLSLLTLTIFGIPENFLSAGKSIIEWFIPEE
jgi:hypothetical protein